MTVVSPPPVKAEDRSAENPPPGSVELARAFVESLAERARPVTGSEVEHPPPSLDWDELWGGVRAGVPLERAIGRAVLAADLLLQRPSTVPVPSVIEPVATEPVATEPVAAEPVAVEVTVVEPVAAVPALVEVPTVEAQTAEEPTVEIPIVEELVVATEPRQAARRARVAFAVFGWIRNVGAIVILFVPWQIWGTSISQGHAQGALRSQFEAKIGGTAPSSPSANPVHLVPATSAVPEPPEGTVIAHLQIPKIGLDQFVVEGTAEADLAKGPGHYVGTALPGQAGNVAIAGHRTTYGAPFNHLDELSMGDRVLLTTASGEMLSYLVSVSPAAVSPHDVAVLDFSGDNRLTLTTCTPKFSAAQRLVVVAVLANPFAPTPSTAVGGARAGHRVTVTTGFTGWHWSYLFPAILVLSGLVGLGIGYRRVALHLGSLGRLLVLAPIWVAGLYLLFGVLTNLLPASV
jgi:sortase A